MIPQSKKLKSNGPADVTPSIEYFVDSSSSDGLHDVFLLNAVPDVKRFINEVLPTPDIPSTHMLNSCTTTLVSLFVLLSESVDDMLQINVKTDNGVIRLINLKCK